MIETDSIFGFLETPIGRLKISAKNGFLTNIDFIEAEEMIDKNGAVLHFENSDSIVRETKSQLTAYFQRKLKVFDLPVLMAGTPFQNSIWMELQQIPYGETMSYKALAYSIKNPLAVRAVGLANGANPIPIVVPCHRVIGANQKLVGYRGKRWRKQYLLELEGIQTLSFFNQ